MTIPTTTKGAPGQWLKRSAERSTVARIILNHAHALQIIDDHQLLWWEAEDEEERERIRARCRKQLLLSGGHAVGFDMAVHGTVAMMFDPMIGGAVFLLGAVITYITRRGH